MMMKAEISTMQLQAREHKHDLQTPEATRGKEGFSPTVFRSSMALLIL